MDQNNNQVSEVAQSPSSQPVVAQQVTEQTIPPQKPESNNPSITMWDNLEYALMFISMYVLATSVGLFIHYYVDKFFPPLNSDYDGGSIFSWIFLFSSGDAGGGGILPALASAMIVTYPLFAFLFLHTKKRAKENPELHHLKLRKGLIYNTLIITFLFMLYKLISLVYGSLTGNFSVNFILHFLVTVGINALIFLYFFYGVRTEKHE